MSSLAIPLRISTKGLDRNTDQKKSIDHSLSLLMNTPCYNCAADPMYGFIFNNMRFEIFNENEGVVFNSSDSPYIFEGPDGLYEKKISGTSKNLNTFASELKNTIGRYEKRLSDIDVSMSYARKEKRIRVTIQGIINETGANYQYQTAISVWK